MKKVFSVVAALMCVASVVAQPKLAANNVEEIIKAMTLEEKATLLVGAGWGSMNAGSMTASSTVLVSGAAGTTRPIERLGIPATVLADGPAGLRISPTREGTEDTFYCTGFPVGTVMACSWNTELVEQVGKAMGEEVLEYGRTTREAIEQGVMQGLTHEIEGYINEFKQKYCDLLVFLTGGDEKPLKNRIKNCIL